MLRKQDFHYDLPEELIAQHPLEKRDSSRLLLLSDDGSEPVHSYFSRLPDHLKAGDCLVINNTKVLPARLLGSKRESGIAVEVLLLKRIDGDVWECLVKPGRRLHAGQMVDFIPDKLSAEIVQVVKGGNRLVKFFYKGIWEEILDEAGMMPLPPYIHEQLSDKQRYQTVYAQAEGSAAAPTAGLHFTPELLEQLKSRNIRIAELTLHVGLGTFRPVKADNILDHEMHSEYYEISQKTVDMISETKKSGHRVIAVGTTSCRVLEAISSKYGGKLKAETGWTDIFIYPGYKFKIIDGLITNFHLPESTLLMLVAALAGHKRIMKAYETAIAEKYRFFSFGDAMLIFSSDRNGEYRLEAECESEINDG
jgi:S-adenosylmethionine:tRNA ribosyltransferase-isomerase